MHGYNFFCLSNCLTDSASFVQDFVYNLLPLILFSTHQEILATFNLHFNVQSMTLKDTCLCRNLSVVADKFLK